jgi:hypothetical protein
MPHAPVGDKKGVIKNPFTINIAVMRARMMTRSKHEARKGEIRN